MASGVLTAVPSYFAAGSTEAMGYSVNEIFVSPQGEGVRAGILHVFIRFSGCNLSCSADGDEGFDCDTDFSNGTHYETAQQLVAAVRAVAGQCKWVLLTGGEPLLQVDNALTDALVEAGFRIAIETNGTRPLCDALLRTSVWVCVSPKTAEHTLRVGVASELKYVIPDGRAIPKPRLKAHHYLLSPVFTPDGIDGRSLRWCLRLLQENPTWRLSLQTHKMMGVR